MMVYVSVRNKVMLGVDAGQTLALVACDGLDVRSLVGNHLLDYCTPMCAVFRLITYNIHYDGYDITRMVDGPRLFMVWTLS